jgi:hypothetical protein
VRRSIGPISEPRGHLGHPHSGKEDLAVRVWAVQMVKNNAPAPGGGDQVTNVQR